MFVGLIGRYGTVGESQFQKLTDSRMPARAKPAHISRFPQNDALAPSRAISSGSWMSGNVSRSSSTQRRRKSTVAQSVTSRSRLRKVVQATTGSSQARRMETW